MSEWAWANDGKVVNVVMFESSVQSSELIVWKLWTGDFQCQILNFFVFCAILSESFDLIYYQQFGICVFYLEHHEESGGGRIF